MKRTSHFALRTSSFALALVFTACASQPDASMHAPSAVASTPSTPCPSATSASLNATLWMQTAAEYQAITREVYRTAKTQLDLALADPSWSALPDVSTTAASQPAIVLDLDETAIDTSAQTARQIRSAKGYSEQAWLDFSMKGNSRAIAAARDFLKYAASRGVAIFYVTNRNKSEEEPLRSNLTALGFPMADAYDNVLTRGERQEWTSDKSSRRMFVASNHRVVILLGDDLNDFVNATGKSLAERQDLLNRYDDMWGRKWFVLPNPVYGSWERATFAGTSGDCAQFQKKIDTLRTDEDYKP